MKIKPSTYFLVFILILILAFIIVSLTYPYIESKLIPLLISSVIFILVSIELFKELLAEKRREMTGEKKIAEPEAKASDVFRRFASPLGWIVGFLIAIYLLGFIVATPLFIFFFLKLNGRGWVMAIVFAAIVTAVVYFLFDLTLTAGLYKGLLFL